MPADPRRAVPATDLLLADERLRGAHERLGRSLVRDVVRRVQAQVRAGALAPDGAVEAVLDQLPDAATTLVPVVNATGVVLHTNLGRAPLSEAAQAAIGAAGGYVDVEFDVRSGVRAARGRGALAALRSRLPEAGDVLVVNNGAAALLLAVTALAQGREVIWSRGEMVEIGDGFRLPDLVASTGARLREVGTTNRTSRQDYLSALGDATGCILKVHPSNFRIDGFTAAVPVADLAGLGVPLVVDTGSGVLRPEPLLPLEPDMATTLRDGADLVVASGDKLLGGPQAGIIAGAAPLVARLRRHPMARALRVDKLTLAALEATLRGPEPPASRYLRARPAELRARCQAIAEQLGAEAAVVPHDGAVGGGSATGVDLPGWAVSLPEGYAGPLRSGRPPVVGCLVDGRCLLDLRCVPAAQDRLVVEAVRACR